VSRRRFFVSEIRRGAAQLTGSEAEHLARVLRVESGQRFELSDNQNLYLAEIETVRKSLVSFRVLEDLPAPPPQAAITLLPALFKFDRFEWLVEKATELGVAVIQPWEAVRTERGLAQAASKRLARWRKIALESSQQSRRARLPGIEPVIKLAAALQTAADVHLLLDEDPAAPPILGVLPTDRAPTSRIALLLGPEGGFTDSERAEAIAAQWLSCTLGPTILRAETAAVAALAILRAAWR
jgi:16S rRNA (uracil1498-N3)-methyltransferase